MEKFGHLVVVFCLSFWGMTLQAQNFELEQFATGLDLPVDLQNADDDRLFAVEKNGTISIINADGSVESTFFLDITDRVVNNAGERGLLGLAFHPNYADNGYFYVNYTTTSGTTIVSRFSVTADANLADAGSEMILMQVEQPFNNHNGGCLQFGPDGYLYIGLGDGGSGNDPFDLSQDPQELLGKMLRIDVDNGSPYGIPADNPFIGNPDVLDEIWALGLRNPWRYSFDRQTGDMWIGDVGQGSFEEIDFEPASSTGGLNYGWKCREGFSPANGNSDDCENFDPSIATDPVHDYPTSFSFGKSVTGGYVYRGTENPDFVGQYIYGDFVTGRIWSLSPDGSGGFTNQELLDWTDNNLSSFGEDADGEMYVVAFQEGNIYKIIDACSNFQVASASTNITCNGDMNGSISVTPPDANSTIIFENGATDFELTGLAAGDYVATVTGANGCTAEIMVTITEPDALEATTNVTDVTCFGDADGAISVVPSDNETTILFDSGETDFDLTGLSGGDYTATITDSNGCTTTISATVTEPEEIDFDLDVVGDMNGAGGNIVAPEGFANYEWYESGELVMGENGSSIPNNGPDASYYVIVTDDNGCMFTSEELFFVLNVNQIPNLNQFEISPNPFINQISLQLSTETAMDLELQILNLDGKVLQEEHLKVSSNFSKIINLSELAEGVYLLRLNAENGTAVQKIVKQ